MIGVGYGSSNLGIRLYPYSGSKYKGVGNIIRFHGYMGSFSHNHTGLFKTFLSLFLGEVNYEVFVYKFKKIYLRNLFSFKHAKSYS